MDFLSTLGWPVNVWRHPGWTGHSSTSWRVQTEPMKPLKMPNHGGSVFNGDHHVLYWADALNEIAFVVPSENNKNKPEPEFSDPQPPTSSSKGLTLDLENTTNDQQSSSHSSSSNNINTKRKSGITGKFYDNDVRLFVVWIENYEDYLNFPADDLLNVNNNEFSNNKDCFIIFIHPLNSGLLRIKLQGQISK